MRLITLLLASCLVAGPALAADTHPFSVHDMLAMDRISDPRVSPDGTRVAFTVAHDRPGRQPGPHRPLPGRHRRRLGAPAHHRTRRATPRRAGRRTARPSTSSPPAPAPRRSGASTDGRRGRAGDRPAAGRGRARGGARRHSAWSSRWPSSRARRPPTPRRALDAREKSKASGLLYDRLFVRHWDTWADGTRNHLFVYDAAPSGRPAT